MTSMIFASLLGVGLGILSSLFIANDAQNSQSGDYNFSGALALVGGVFISLVLVLISLPFQMFWLTALLPSAACFAIHLFFGRRLL